VVDVFIQEVIFDAIAILNRFKTIHIEWQPGHLTAYQKVAGVSADRKIEDGCFYARAFDDVGDLNLKGTRFPNPGSSWFKVDCEMGMPERELLNRRNEDISPI
jgi:hypothetical protein